MQILFLQLFNCRCVSPVNIESLRTDLTTDQERRIIPKIIEMGYVDKSETIEKKLQSLDHKVKFSLDQKDTHQQQYLRKPR